MITFSHACDEDIKLIKKFINKHWKKNHILIKNKEVFNFYYCITRNKPQFYIAKDSKNQIHAILGYITNKQFDNQIPVRGVWLALFCAKKNATKGVGIMLLNKLETSLDADFIASLGVGSRVLPIYKRLGYQTGKINHFIKKINSSKIKKNSKIKINTETLNKKLYFRCLDKSLKYFTRKYKNNSFYKYYFFSIQKKETILTFLVAKVLRYKKDRIFRIIDFIGDIEGISLFANNYDFNLIDNSIKFIDILCSSPFYDFKLKSFLKSNKKNYLPLYFEPLIDSYSEKNYIFKNKKNINKDFLIITGDGDQDRPNKI